MSEDEEEDTLTVLDWEEWLERTNLGIDEDRPVSEILREWRRQPQLAPTDFWVVGRRSTLATAVYQLIGGTLTARNALAQA